MDIKQCLKCKQDLNLSEFNKKGTGLQKWCRSCQKEDFKQRYEGNKQHYIDRAVKRRQNVWIWWAEYKKQFKCSQCPEDHPACLDFHHINDDKEKAVSYFIWKGQKQAALREIEKCIVLCANCHRKEHTRVYN